jgi:hypothetical protein
MACLSGLQAAETDRVTLSWQELKKWLDLDQSAVQLSFEDFRKLLLQTGQTTRLNLEISGSKISIPRQQFSQLLSLMKAATVSSPIPPQPYVIQKAAYTAIRENKSIRFKAVYQVFLSRQEPLQYQSIPLVSQQLALTELKADGKPASVTLSNQWQHVSLFNPGAHEIVAEFFVSDSNQSLAIEIPRAMINQLDFLLDMPHMEITVSPGLNPQLRHSEQHTRITAMFPPSSRLEIHWKEHISQREKRPPVFYGSTRSLISVARDVVSLTSNLKLEVVQGELENVLVQIPAGFSVLKATGPAVGDWRLKKTPSRDILEIIFKNEITDHLNLQINAEQIFSHDVSHTNYSGLAILDAKRESGELGVVAEGGIEVDIEEQPGPGVELTKLAFNRLGQDLLNMSEKPILYACKYAKHPFQLLFHIKKFQQIEGMNTVIDQAKIYALYLPEGKMICRTTYTLQNTFKQFMELTLPDNASVWTVTINGQRAKASRNQAGKIMIPLLRSDKAKADAKPFDIEFTYSLPDNSFGIWGKKEVIIPLTDIFINSIALEIYLPAAFKYSFHQHDWKQLIDQPVSPNRLVKKKKKSRFSLFGKSKQAPAPEKSLALEEADGAVKGSISQDKAAEEKKSKDEYNIDGVNEVEMKPGVEGGVEGTIREEIVVTGIAPLVDVQSTAKTEAISETVDQGLAGPAGINSIPVFLPLSGHKYIFNKTIVNQMEPLPLSFQYHAQGLRKIIIAIIILLLLLLLMFFFRAHLRHGKKI